MEDEDQWKALSLTHVEYQVNDPLGKFFAIFSLLPLASVIVFMTAFFFRRDLHTLTFAAGLIVNYICNSMLKKYIKEPRPMHRSVQFEEFGMPSTHSQWMWFCSCYLVLFSVFRLTNTLAWKLVCVLLSLAASILMAYSRVYLQYHTVAQVVWGGVVGGVGAVIWFLLTQWVFTPLYPVIERWRISEYFMIRDTSTIPNILWFEFVTIRGEVNTRKKVSARKSS